MNAIGDTLERKERPAYATFHREAVEDKAASRAAGQYVGKDVDFVHVTPPYSKDKMIWKVAEWFENLRRDQQNGRIPPEWVETYKKQYEAWQKGEEPSPTGSPIKGWGVISPAQQETLTRMGILTVEDLSQVNDEGLRRIGMGSIDLKNKAKAWLAQLQDKGALTMEVAADKAKIRELEGQVATLTKNVESLLSAVRVDRPAAEAAMSAISASDLMDAPSVHDDLVAQYTAKFGKPPHHRKHDDTIRAELGL